MSLKNEVFGCDGVEVGVVNAILPMPAHEVMKYEPAAALFSFPPLMNSSLR